MRGRTGLLFMLAVAALVVSTAGAGAAERNLRWPTASFSGTLLIRNGEPRGPQTITVRIFNAGPKLRMDTTAGGRRLSIIFDREARTTWAISHARKLAVRQPYNPKQDFALRFNRARGTLEREAVETVNGVRAVKYKFVGRNIDGDAFEGHIWRTRQGIVVRWLESRTRPGKARPFAMDLKDLKVGALPPGTFAPPKGYQVRDLSRK